MHNNLNIKILDNSNYGPQSIHHSEFIKYQPNDYNFYPIQSQISCDKLLNLNHEIKNIKSISDVLKICERPIDHFQPCNYQDLVKLKSIAEPLKELDQMIGMQDIKMKILYHALFYCQNLHQLAIQSNLNYEGDLMNVVIQGPPGSGKTTVAKLIGKIYLKLGILKNNKFVMAHRKDLIAEFVGQTAPKTTKFLQSALGGVLFIDEAYSLGNPEKRDIFAKECIDTINQFLTEHKSELIVIIAGYKENLQKCFFDMNPGLERRFPWVYDIDQYSPHEIRLILIKQIIDSGWSFINNNPNEVIPLNFINEHRLLFNFSGGDTEIFVHKCQIAHSLNTFGLSIKNKSKLTHEDILKGLDLFQSSKQKSEIPNNESYNHFYT